MAFDSPNAHEAVKGIRSKPRSRRLRRKVPEQELHLTVGLCTPQRDVKVRISEITLVLRNFVLEDEVVSERVPLELGYDAMVLVEILGTVREDQVRFERSSSRFEEVFDLTPHRRKITFAE